MIKVTVKYANDEVTSLVVKGHALSAEPGKDLVCAGVSAVTIGALNSLEDSEISFQITIEDGFVSVIPEHRMTTKNSTVMNVLITSLKTIAESYGEYIKIIEERNIVT
ncbi:MAG TPA: ribosomal-processing cysteine protease Prp [Bacilli bacterium]|nr:ribosomal-processing cysteine protease Prp [Bacilli bacterium]